MAALLALLVRVPPADGGLSLRCPTTPRPPDPTLPSKPEKSAPVAQALNWNWGGLCSSPDATPLLCDQTSLCPTERWDQPGPLLPCPASWGPHWSRQYRKLSNTQPCPGGRGASALRAQDLPTSDSAFLHFHVGRRRPQPRAVAPDSAPHPPVAPRPQTSSRGPTESSQDALGSAGRVRHSRPPPFETCAVPLSLLKPPGWKGGGGQHLSQRPSCPAGLGPSSQPGPQEGFPWCFQLPILPCLVVQTR